MNNLQVGQVVAFCYRGSHGARRLRDVTVTEVKKTFVEINDGSRFSAKDLRQKSDCHGGTGYRDYYLDTDVAFWDQKDSLEQAMRELNSAFETLISAAKNRNWENTKAAFEALNNLIGK